MYGGGQLAVDRYPCGHRKTRANTRDGTCIACKPRPLSGDPAIALYRFEKQKRLADDAAKIAACREQFMEAIAARPLRGVSAPRKAT